MTMRAYSWVGTLSAAMLLLGLLTEYVVYRRGGCCLPCTRVSHSLESLRQRGLGITLVHIATSSIAIFSVCAAAVNIYENATTGLYALSCAVLAFYWMHMVLYTPSTTMHLAVHHDMPEAEQLLNGLQQNATRLVWRNSTLNPTDYL